MDIASSSFIPWESCMSSLNNVALEEALKRFCICLEEEKYFEGHEILEEAWHPLRRQQDPLASPVKGLINAAIAFEHLRRNRPKSRRVAEIAMASYQRRIREEPRFRETINLVERLRLRWKI